MFTILLAAALASQSPVPGKSAEELIRYPEFKTMMEEVGIYYYLAGRCSAFISVEGFEMLMMDARTWGVFSQKLEELYTEGQNDTSEPAPSARVCETTLEETEKKYKAAVARFDGTLKAGK